MNIENEKMTVHGHRGARAIYPENTLVGFGYAIEVGVDAIEIDVVVTRDNEVIIAHDPFVNKTIMSSLLFPNKTPFRFLSLNQVKKIDCGSKKHPKFSKQKAMKGEKIPTLAEFFEFINNHTHPNAKNVKINLEAKLFIGYPLATPAPQRFAQLIFDIVKKYNFEERVIFQSFDYRILSEMKKLSEKMSYSMLTENGIVDFVSLQKGMGIEFASPQFKWLDAIEVKRLKESGLKVVPWTVNKKSDWKKMIAMGVSGIITDDPEGLIRYLKKRGLR